MPVSRINKSVFLSDSATWGLCLWANVYIFMVLCSHDLRLAPVTGKVEGKEL